MNYCPKCGQALTGSERFCGHCGQDLLADKIETDSADTTLVDVRHTLLTYKWPLLIGLALVLFILGTNLLQSHPLAGKYKAQQSDDYRLEISKSGDFKFATDVEDAFGQFWGEDSGDAVEVNVKGSLKARSEAATYTVDTDSLNIEMRIPLSEVNSLIKSSLSSGLGSLVSEVSEIKQIADFESVLDSLSAYTKLLGGDQIYVQLFERVKDWLKQYCQIEDQTFIVQLNRQELVELVEEASRYQLFDIDLDEVQRKLNQLEENMVIELDKDSKALHIEMDGDLEVFVPDKE